MFKKAIKIGAQNQLSGKDKKIIKSKMSEAFDQHSVQKMLAANDKIICNKVSGSKMLIYVGEDYPLIVDGTGKNNYFPSIYLCAAFQPLLKSLIINEGVQAYIFNGANLMWPGVQSYQGLKNFAKDEVIAIRSSKGEIIAIGAMGCSLEQLQKSNDFSGVANYVLHYKGDKLWDMGPKTYPQIIIPLPVAAQTKKQQQKPKVEEQKPKVQEQKPKVQQKKAKEQKSKQKVKEQKKPKSQSEPEQSDDDNDFMNLVHSRQTRQTQQKPASKKHIQMQQKNNLKQAFVEDQNIQNKKNKKKQAKKGGKKQSEDEMSEEEKPQKNDKNKNKKNKKGGKKQQSEQEIQEEEKPQKNDKNKKKQPKKQQKKHQKSEPQQQQQDVMEEEEEVQQKQDKKKKGGKGKGGKNKKQKQHNDKQKGQGQQNNEEEQAPSAINSKLMDEYFKESLMNSIKLTKIQNQLPIDSGRFYMDFMLLARPQGVKLQIKDSSYKKIGKFFQQMAKQKIIQYKHTKDKKVQGAVINKIFWENQQLKNFVPTIKKMNTKESLQQKVETYSKAKLKLSKTVVCQTVYKPNEVLFNLLFKKPVNYMPDNSDDEVTDNQKHQAIYVQQKELRQKIEKYVNTIVQNNKEVKQKQGKQKQGKQKKVVQKGILIDYKKHAFIANLLKKQIDQYEENKARQQILKPQDDEEDKKKRRIKGKPDMFKIDRPFLVQKIMKLAIPHYHLYDKEAKLDKFKQGTFKGVQIIAEKANNKNITTIIGLQTFITPQEEADDQINGFANQLQLKFACSVNVQNLPGKNAGKEIIAHGTFLDQLVDMFQQQNGLASKFITTQNKLDKKKKH